MSIKRVYIYAYNRASKSVKALVDALSAKGITAVRRDKNTHRPPRLTDIVVTWGSSEIPNWSPEYYVNTPDKIHIASDKLQTFLKLKEANVSIPEFTTDVSEATSWLPDSYVVCRKLLRSSGGKGIVLAKSAGEVVDAPLYVKYKRKQHEYRLHVWKGTIIDAQEKRRSSAGVGNDYIRNHTNGWVFCRDSLVLPDGLDNLAYSACSAVGLDFGAVDIIYNEKSKKAYVLEINTAPGLEGTTLNNYVKAICS